VPLIPEGHQPLPEALLFCDERRIGVAALSRAFLAQFAQFRFDFFAPLDERAPAVQERFVAVAERRMAIARSVRVGKAAEFEIGRRFGG
jgi:hypothetical protein